MCGCGGGESEREGEGGRGVVAAITVIFSEGGGE